MFGKVFRWGCATPILLLAIYGLWMLPGALIGQFVKLYGLPAPPASAYYDVHIHNATVQDLVIAVCNVNDLAHVTQTTWEKAQRALARNENLREKHVPPGGEARFVVPSVVSSDIGLLSVTARTSILKAPGTEAQQMVAIFLLDGSLLSIRRHTMTSERVIEIRERHLLTLPLENSFANLKLLAEGCALYFAQ